MQKKLSLLLAALLVAVSAQTAWAVDVDDDEDAPAIHMQADVDADDENGDDADHPLRLSHPGHWRRGMMRGMMRGHGPQMMPGMRMRGNFAGQGMGNRRFGHFGTPMMRELDLSDAQKSQFIDAMADIYKKRLTLRIQQDDVYQKLKAEYEGGNPNRDNIVAYNTALGELKGQLDIIGHDYHDRIQSILTPEQREKVKENMEKMEQRIKERREQRGDRGPRDGRGPGSRGDRGDRGDRDRGPGPRGQRGPGGPGGPGQGR